MLVFADPEVHRQASAATTYYNRSSAAHLYAGPRDPRPDTPLGAFSPPIFDTYNPILLNGLWRPPQKAIDGEWILSVGPVVWAPPFTITGVVNGWYLTAFDALVCSQRFADPITMVPGGNPLVILIELEFLSGAVWPGV